MAEPRNNARVKAISKCCSQFVSMQSCFAKCRLQDTHKHKNLRIRCATNNVEWFYAQGGAEYFALPQLACWLFGRVVACGILLQLSASTNKCAWHKTNTEASNKCAKTTTKSRAVTFPPISQQR